MENIAELSNKDPEEIERAIEITKYSLQEKLEELKGEVKSTVEGVENTVREKLVSAKRAVDFRYHMQQRPWSFVAAAVVTGVVITKLANDAATASATSSSSNSNFNNGRPLKQLAFDEIRDSAGKELRQLKSTLIGSLFKTLRKMAEESF